jgi:hypothetical protein
MTTIDDIHVGANVLDQRGRDLGTVEAIGTGYFVLARTSIFGRDLFVPFLSIELADSIERVVRLTVAKDDLDELGWEEPPEVSTPRLTSAPTSSPYLPS